MSVLQCPFFTPLYDLNNDAFFTAVKREKCAKNTKNMSKARRISFFFFFFAAQRLILYQYPVDLLSYLKLGKFGLAGSICQSNFVQVRSILE